MISQALRDFIESTLRVLLYIHFSVYQNKNCCSIKQYILTTSCLDILIDCGFFSNKQHHPISLKYSLWPGYRSNRAMWKKEVFSLRDFSYFEIGLPPEASPICKKKQSPDFLSASEITYWFFDSPEITNETAIRFFFWQTTEEKREKKLARKYSLLQQNLICDKF